MRFSMPFSGKEEAREEICRLALQEGANRRQLCRRFKISPTTLYTVLARYRSEGPAGLTERSRRPHRSPSRTVDEMEAAVLEVRRENPVWGGRKIAACLRRQGLSPPAPSTITEILQRHGQPMVSAGQKAWKRFEHAEPNALLRHDLQTGETVRHHYGQEWMSGEVIFVPRHPDAQEDEGWLLSYVHGVDGGPSQSVDRTHAGDHRDFDRICADRRRRWPAAEPRPLRYQSQRLHLDDQFRLLPDGPNSSQVCRSDH